MSHFLKLCKGTYFYKLVILNILRKILSSLTCLKIEVNYSVIIN